MSTRSKAAGQSRASTRSRPHLTAEEEMRAIERESEREVLEQQMLAKKRADDQAREKKAAEQNAAAQGTSEEESGENQAIEQDGSSSSKEQDADVQQEQEVLEQSFDFESLSYTSSDDHAMDLDASPPPEAQQPADPYADTTLTRLQKASAETDPNHTFTFPFNRVLPKAVVFLRCQDSHVFALPSQLASLSAAEDSHAIARVMAPCPQCVSDKATTEVFANRKCAFCMVVMPRMSDGRYVCLTQPCWFARCHVDRGSDKAMAAWKEVWRTMGNRYFFVGPWEDVLSYSNDLDRNGEEKPAAYSFTV